MRIVSFIVLVLLALISAGCAVLPNSMTGKPGPVTAPTAVAETRSIPPKVALALGGGAARGFA